MEVRTASSPGRDGRANEDFVGSVPGAAVLLDGAAVPGMGEVCRHGVGWYVQTRGTTLLRLLPQILRCYGGTYPSRVLWAKNGTYCWSYGRLGTAGLQRAASGALAAPPAVMPS